MKKVLVFILFLISTEIFLRIVKPDSLEFYRVQKSFHALVDNYFIDLEPNTNVRVKHFQNIFDIHFSTNEKGFRGSPKVDNSKPQIICIGDSVTMGFGVSDEDTFCNKLDHYKDSRNIEYQALNLGVDAYGPSAISLKLQKFLPELNPKILYYFPSTGDDIDERVFHERTYNKTTFSIFKFQFLLTKYCYLCLGLKIAQEQIFYRTKETFIWPLEKINKTRLCMDKKIPEDECSDTYFPYKDFSIVSEFTSPKSKDPYSPPSFPKSECMEEEPDFKIPTEMIHKIDEIIKISEERNIKLVMVLAPIDIETAYCSQKGKHHRYYGYLSHLAKYLTQKKIDFINLNEYAHLMKDDEGNLNARLYYIVGDGHYTKRGNQWIADILISRTKEILNAL